MPEINMLGRALIFIGVIIAIVGILIVTGVKVPWLGKLPGDIYIQKRGMTFYFPITTSILISVVLSIILMLLRRR